MPRALFLQNCQAEDAGSLEGLLKERGLSYETCHVYRGEAIPEDFDVLVVGGTPVSANDVEQYDDLRREWDVLERAVGAGTPVLGLCFGGQILARVLGAEVRRNPVMEIGGYEVRRTEAGARDPLLRGFPSAFPVFHWHGDTFEIPAGAERLVEGDDCPNQAFRAGRAVGLQFHIEVSSADAVAWADAYADELAQVGKTKAQVVEECAACEPRMRELAARLVDNWLAL